MNIAFLDIETTGLDPGDGYILEVGIVITNPALDILATASWLVDNGVAVEILQEDCDPRAVEMHTKSGLWDELAGGSLTAPSRIAIEAAVILGRHDAFDGPLAGSTISFDRGWLAYHMPHLLGCWHYRNLDVTSFKEWLRLTGNSPLPPKAEPAHRAVPDCLESIEAMRAMRGLVI